VILCCVVEVHEYGLDVLLICIGCADEWSLVAVSVGFINIHE